MSHSSPITLLAWHATGPATPWVPVRLLEAPGIAVLRQNLDSVRTETNPLPSSLEQLARCNPGVVHCLFGAPDAEPALAACHRLAHMGVRLVAVRGRCVPKAALALFDELSFAPDLLSLLAGHGVALPERWVHPPILAELYAPKHVGVRRHVVFTCVPEPGLLDLRDVGVSVRRRGAAACALDRATDLRHLSRQLTSGTVGRWGALGVDNGGNPAPLAALLVAHDKLAGWFAPAARPLPREVLEAGAAVYRWFEPEDRLELQPSVARGCAYVPVGLPGESPAEAIARVLATRELGYTAIVPRYHVPIPNTSEWQQLELTLGMRGGSLGDLDGRRCVFSLPGYPEDAAEELLALIRRDNRWFESSGTTRRRTSFRDVRRAIDDYLSDAASRIPDCHAFDVFSELREAVDPGTTDLRAHDAYPFVAWRGTNLLDVVQRAVEDRLRSLDGLPEPLLRAVQHCALAGGKRIRPILTLVLAASENVAIETAMPAALAIEWIHTASLIQDDLPCMDDDAIRRRNATVHMRHGEGLAVLASDCLIALAFEDVARCADDARVGPRRAATMLAVMARVIGAHGLCGGQARDLLTRQRDDVTLQDVLNIHHHKTVPLFRLTAQVAGILGDARLERRRRMIDAVERLGLAFQIVDDALDATPDNPCFGRPAGTDARNALPTFATLMGHEAARRYARQIMGPSLSLFARKPRGTGLLQLAHFVLERQQ